MRHEPMVAEIDSKHSEDVQPRTKRMTPVQLKNQGKNANPAIRWQTTKPTASGVFLVTVHPYLRTTVAGRKPAPAAFRETVIARLQETQPTPSGT